MIHMLASCGENEVGFRFRSDRFHRMVEQETPQTFGKKRPARFSGMQHVQALRSQPLTKSSSLGRFSASFTAFQRDKNAARCSRRSTHRRFSFQPSSGNRSYVRSW